MIGDTSILIRYRNRYFEIWYRSIQVSYSNTKIDAKVLFSKPEVSTYIARLG